MKKLVALAALAGVTLASAPAAAQQAWLSDRSLGEGAGIRTGNLELHPGIAGEFGYDTNYFRRSGGANEPVLSAYRLRITPSLSLSTLGEQRTNGGGGPGSPPALKLRAGLFAVYNEILPATDRFRNGGDHRRLDLGAELKLDVLPSKPVGGDVHATYLRVGEPSNSEDPDFAFDRSTVVTGAGVEWRPGGGLFQWRLGYDLQYTWFEREAFEPLNNLVHTVSTRERFRFVPKTALIHEAKVKFRSYLRERPTLNDGQSVSSRIGVAGLITKRVSTLALVGWGATFYDAGVGSREDYDSFIAQAELRYFLLPRPGTEEVTAGQSSAAVGYVRDFGNSYLGNFFARDRGYVEANMFFAGVVVAGARASLSNYHYPNIFFSNGALQQGSFNQLRAQVGLFAEYRFSDSVGVNTSVDYDANLGNNRIRTNPADATQVDDISYSRLTAFVGLRWFL